MKSVTEQFLKDVIFGIDWALDKIPDECDCDGIIETDTNAPIHQEDKCQAFCRYHLEATKDNALKVLNAVGVTTPDDVCMCNPKPECEFVFVKKIWICSGCNKRRLIDE